LAKVITPFATQSSMNAMLFCNIVLTVPRHSGEIGAASRPSSADCIRLRKASIGARHDRSAGLSMYGPTTSLTAIVLCPTDFSN
jgi:hypothetical protein